MTIAHDIAGAILDGFDRHYRIFRETAASAKERFERGDWHEVRRVSRLRIDLYDERVRETVAAISDAYPAARGDEALWPIIKRAYIELLYEHRRAECAETFYNSVACRVLDRTYYRNEYIFWRPAVATDFVDSDTYRCYYPAKSGVSTTLQEILGSFALNVPYEDLNRDVRRVMHVLHEHFPAPRAQYANFHVQILSSLFFRNTGAYIVGKIVNGNDEYPLAISIRHVSSGGALYIDAVLLTRAQVGRLFNLARAYFTVDMDVPSAFVSFLHQLMPDHTVAELYTAVGLQKQGKTLFYRDLHSHLRHSSDRFIIAPGVLGMVMVVFTLPSFPYVFKVIRDSFKPPKQTSRAEVKRKYLLVKYHDRVGRMADTLEYSDVAFPIARLDTELIVELEHSCASQLDRDGENLILRHLYIERRMVPLDVFLRDANDERAESAIREFGRAIRELAEADIFPGDLLTKNFGVTRAGRVVFYDYDEVSTLNEVTFKALPAARNDTEEVQAEPWFHVSPTDAFPEEWPAFLFQKREHRALFIRLYPEIVDPGWWASRQEDIRNGVLTDVYPYPDELRLANRA